MTDRQTTIERAFQFAKSGEFADTSEIRERLRREGYRDVTGQISGPTLLRQLRKLCDAARASQAADAPRDHPRPDFD